MMQSTHGEPKSPTSDREIVQSRVFDAPRALVFAAWTNPRHLEHWWGPKGFDITTRSAEVRPGGAWRFVMHAPDGAHYEDRIEYVEIARPERIVYLHGEDKDDDPERFHVTITFEDAPGGKTKVTMRSVFPTAAQREKVIGFGAIELGKQTLEKLAEHLRRGPEMLLGVVPDEPVVIIRRGFDAPVRLVFEACTKAEHFARWWGPRGSTLSVCEVDARPGGRWRCVMRTRDGREHGFGGEYREVVPNERIVYTFRYDGAPDVESVETITFTEVDGRTVLTNTVVHSSIANRDGHVATGMETGARDSMDRLGEVVAGLVGPSAAAATEIRLERVFDAPRRLVFEMWTDARHFAQWFGPKGAGMSDCHLDPRPGGVLRFVHEVPDGPRVHVKGTFREVVAPERLVFEIGFVDESGAPAAHPMLRDWPIDARIVTTVTFADEGGRTALSVHQIVSPPSATASGAVARQQALAQHGWRETLDRLDEVLSNAR